MEDIFDVLRTKTLIFDGVFFRVSAARSCGSIARSIGCLLNRATSDGSGGHCTCVIAQMTLNVVVAEITRFGDRNTSRVVIVVMRGHHGRWQHGASRGGTSRVLAGHG